MEAISPTLASAPGRSTPGRRLRRVLLAVVIPVLATALVSWLSAVTGPSNSGVGIRTVEWLRDHGASGLVSGVEDTYYSLTAPAKGGAALRALPSVGVATGPATSPAPALSKKAAGPRPTYRPRRITPVIHPSLPGEGVWRPSTLDMGSSAPVLLATFRNEAAYPREVTGVAWIDATRTKFTYIPGRLEPPGLAARGSSQVPQAGRFNLAATFNGGFKLKDQDGGFAYRGRTYKPMLHGDGTLLQYRDGRVDIRTWTGGARVTSNVAFARQNLPLIVDHRRPNPNLGDGPQWGATVGNRIRVWRSGIGVDQRGNLIYAAANNQTVSSLADSLIRAGAVRALELDINEYWVNLITYRHRGAAGPTKLLSGMVRPVQRYLTPDDRDFFAIYEKRARRGTPAPAVP